MLPLAGGDMLLYLYDGWHICSYPHGDNTFKQPFSFLENTVSGDFPGSRLFKVFGKFLLDIPPRKDSLQLLDEEGRILDSRPFPYNKYPYISWSQQVITIALTLEYKARSRTRRPCSIFLRFEMSRPVPKMQGWPASVVRAQWNR